jgi:hypothetical protein
VGEAGSRFRSNWQAITASAAALVTALATLVGALAATGVLGGGSDTPKTQSTSTTSSAPVELPFEATESELRLAGMIPLVFRPKCQRADPLPDTRASLFCDNRPDGAVTYHLFSSASALTAYMDNRRSLGNSGAKCGDAASGSSTYHVESGETVGQLVCYLHGGRAWIEWTNLQSDVYADAYRDDDDWKALFNFWQGAGPRT